jgi:phosphate transport system substrate-binding protein
MSSRSIKRYGRLVVGGASVLAVVALGACDYSPDGDQDTLAFVGSDTTQDVMNAVVGNYNADTSYNNDTNTPADDRDILRNVLSVQGTPLNVPADEHCGSITYHTPAGGGEVASPNGSGAGRDALKASVLAGDGCIDIARSSGAPRAVGSGAGQDPASFEYYAFALDAVGWSSASTLAPASLTQAQLISIYNCTFTNWNQVGGGSGAIQRYWPQAGSGTRSFAQSDLLNGFDPTTVSSGSCPAVVLTQENSGELVDTNNAEQTAILPYSGANWVAQARGTAPDQRHGQLIGQLNGQSIVRTDDGQFELAAQDSEFPTAPVAESNVKLVDSTPDYPGIRFVFNVIDNTSPSYTSAKRYVAFDNADGGATSPLCSGALGNGASVQSLGFGQLSNTVGPHNLAGSLCRLYVPV